jgi:phosphate butyryltransferase
VLVSPGRLLEMIKNFKELLNTAQKGDLKYVSVVVAHEQETLKAVVKAEELGVAVPLLVGDRYWITTMLHGLEVNPKDFEIIHEKDPQRAVAAATDVAKSGHADILMKGGVVTSKFLQVVLGSPSDLRRGLLSDVAVYEDKKRHGHQLVLVSDGGINISPGIRQKLEIIQNAVAVAHGLGIRKPKVALLSGSEKVHPDFQSTIDAVALVKMCRDGAVENCVIDGPFALDNAIDMNSTMLKGIESPVAGSADILIMPNLEAGNIFCKCLQYYGNRMLSHVAVGAKVLILIDSRTAKADEKLHSIALAKVMCSIEKGN